MSMFDFEFDDHEDPIDGLRLGDVVESYERARENDSGGYFDSETLEDIATFYFEQERFEEALEVIDRLAGAQPFTSDVWLKRGVILNTLERHEEAIEAYERALAFNPMDSGGEPESRYHARPSRRVG